MDTSFRKKYLFSLKLSKPILNAYKLKSCDLPFEIPNLVQVKQVWQKHFNHSPEHLWLRQIIKKVSMGFSIKK